MNYEAIKSGLTTHNQTEVGIYIQYLQKLETETDRDKKLKNVWFPYFTEKQAIDIYNNVAKDGLFIDGDTITLNFKGSVMVNYNYQAYKNKLLKIYPETLFDIQNVFDGDDFEFSKENGKVVYSHKIGNPFQNSKVIIGCYCIIKNKRGEFLETLNMDDIQKMRNVAKTQVIWDAWEGEMTLKSVIKRACKRHFKDVISNIEIIDNENYEVETVGLDYEIKEEINKCTTDDELQAVYVKFKTKVSDETVFLAQLTKRKNELKKAS